MLYTVGEAAIDWLISWYFAKDRNEAIVLAREMLCMLYDLWCLNRLCLTLETNILILSYLFCGASIECVLHCRPVHLIYPTIAEISFEIHKSFVTHICMHGLDTKLL